MTALIPQDRAPHGALQGLLAWTTLSLVAGCATLQSDAPRHPAATSTWGVEPVFAVSTPAPHSSAGRGYYTLGRYYEGSREWPQAEAAYRRAVAIDPDYPEALDALGVLLGRSGRTDEAETLLRRAVALAPERASLRNNLGYLLLATGHPELAAEQLAASVAADADDVVARANLRVARARLDDATALAAAGAASPASVAITGDEPAPASATLATPTVDVAVAAVAVTQTVEAGLPPMPQVSRAAVGRLEIANGNGVAGMAARVGRLLAVQGLPPARLSNETPFVRQETVVQYRPGNAEAALRIANSLPAAARVEAAVPAQAAADVRVVLGRDWVARATCLQRDDCRPLVVAAAAKTGFH